MTVLVIAAHPDDAEFICGGAIAHFVSSGSRVHYCVVTHGLAGLPHGAEPNTRVQEQREAAQELGVLDVEFLSFPDGRLQASVQLRHDLTRAIRTVRPDLLLTHSPIRNLDSIRFSHPDHLAVGEAALAAVYPDARTAASFPSLLNEGLDPHSVAEVWLFGHDEPNRVVDITEVFDQKLRAIEKHRSQMKSFGDVPSFFREWGVEVAQSHDLPKSRLAEQYRVLDTR